MLHTDTSSRRANAIGLGSSEDVVSEGEKHKKVYECLVLNLL